MSSPLTIAARAPAHDSIGGTSAFARASVLGLLALFAWCMLLALTQQVNSFPDDGWFQSKDRLVGQWLGEDNYTPIGAPALFFAANQALATWLGLSLDGEFYLAAGLQSLLLFASLLLLFGALRRLGISRAIAGTTVACTAAYLGSTLLTQAFWSENTMVLLMAALCRLGVEQWALGPAATRRTLVWHSVALGLLMSLAIVTRVIPLLLFAPMALMLVRRLGLGKALWSSAVSGAIVILVVLLAMAANQHRFGRFELSNSTGRHLWQSLYPIAGQMLGNHPAFPALVTAYPDLEKRDWWAVSPHPLPAYAHLSQEAFLRELSLAAILQHPLRWLRHGLDKFTRVILKPLPRIGLWYRVDPATNLLGRSEPLPALWNDPGGAVRGLLDGIYRAFSTAHAGIVGVPLVVLLGSAAAHTLRRKEVRVQESARDSSCLHALAFFSFAFFCCVYVSLQVEVALDRYTVPYAPFLAMMAGTSVQLLVSAFQRLATAGASLHAVTNSTR